jgi:hypothetical protein
MRSSGLSGYSVGSHLYIFHFVIFTGCSHLTLGWYSVGSRVVISFWRYDNWKHNFLIPFIYYIIIIMWGRSSDSEYRVHAFSRHSPRVLSLRETEFFQDIQGIGTRLLKNPKFISWARIRARLGKHKSRARSCVRLWMDWWFVIELYIYRYFQSRTSYVCLLYIILLSTNFYILGIVCHRIIANYLSPHHSELFVTASYHSELFVITS